MVKKRIGFASPEEAVEILGASDLALKEMESLYGVQMFLRQSPGSPESILWVKGSAARVEKALRKIRQKIESSRGSASAPERAAPRQDFSDGKEGVLYRTSFGRSVVPRTPNQARYIEAIQTHDLVFGVGPAGTGKTFLAVACALKALDERKIQRVVISRPVVEAGEKLGFLPGDFLEKVNPYLSPIYDAFYSLLGPERFRMWRETEVMEIVPLAYMRGRTFESSFIILDEAQNTTPEQMKMFLTRMGRGSKAVVTGDMTQTDLGSPKASGLVLAAEALQNVPGVVFHHLTEDDIARHSLVRDILKAYENWEKREPR